MTSGRINYQVKQIKRYCPEFDFHAHVMRASFAVHCKKSGLSESDIQELLGHKNILTTLRYTRLVKDDLQNEFDKKVK